MKTSRLPLAATLALAITGVAGAAHADQTIYQWDKTFGSGDVHAGLDADVVLRHCNASELAQAGATCSAGTTGCECIPFAGCYLYPECAGTSASQQYAEATTDGTGSITLFGHTDSVRISSSVHTADGASALDLYITAFGNTVFNDTTTNVPIMAAASFSAKKSFSLVGIGVDVKAHADASIGATLGGGAIANGGELTVTPTLDVSIGASAGVSVECASAGVYGSLDALDLSLPTNLSVTVANGQFGYSVDSQLSYSALDGSIGVEACVCGSCDRDTFASYSGWSGNVSVFNGSGGAPL